MDDLNDEQRRAVEVDDGPVLIVAGPGTGKTKTLTAHLVHLIASGRAKPEEVLALTFTKKAAEEMQKRTKNHLDNLLGDVPLKGGKSGIIGAPRIATFHALCHELLDGEAITFVSEQERLALIKSLPRPAALKHLSVREAGLLVSRAKNTPATKDEATRKLVERYDTALREKNLHDFDDLLLQAHELLRTDQIQGRYTHILVDEFQDTNRLQYDFLQLLRGNDNLFVIGDPKQSIYGFRGAGGDIFEQFQADFPKAQKITLHVNYRSAPEIVRLSNAVFPDSAPLQAHVAKSGQARAIQVLNEYSEAAWVLGEIQRTIGGGDFLRAVSDDDRATHRTLKDFAILYRSRSAAIAVQKAVAESGLPYQIVGDGSPYEQPKVQEIVKLLKLLANGQDSEEEHKLVADIDKTLPPSRIAETIGARLGFEQAGEIMQLCNTLVRFDDLSEAVQYLDEIAEQQFYDPNADAITLLTIHAAKGLEFPHVFLVGAEEGILPHAKANPAEEKRLFYVAATRAKERLDILHTTTRSGKSATSSQFITELTDIVLPKTVDKNLATDQRRATKRKLKRSQQSLF